MNSIEGQPPPQNLKYPSMDGSRIPQGRVVGLCKVSHLSGPNKSVYQLPPTPTHSQSLSLSIDVHITK